VQEIEQLFGKQKMASEEFAREMSKLLSARAGLTPEIAARVNLKLAKTVFSKWSIEILTILYGKKSSSFGELKRLLKGINSRVLSEKLKRLESGGLVSREVVDGRPPRSTYYLTEDGITVAKLGEPVFMFLGYKEGLYQSSTVVLEETKW
jgi:DNA-binding HxlR family transcriptional regulator